MKREELKNMLSQVDEQYIAEILDAEEMTSEAASISARPKRFAGWTAAAAVLCICAVGGGCLWWNQVYRQEIAHNSVESSGEATAMQADTIREEHIEHVLVWETEPLDGYQRYERNFNGPIQNFGICELPITVEGAGMSLTLYCDENGTPVDAAVAVQNSGNGKGVIISLSSEGNFYPQYCVADLTEDAEYDIPVIHIFDNTEPDDAAEEYELYYLHEGTAMTMRTYGFSAEEAEAFAAAFLQDGTTPAKLAETATNGVVSDRGDYMLVWDEGEQLYIDPAPESLDYPDSYSRYSTKLIPIGGDDFTEIYGNVGFDADGIPYSVFAEYSNDSQRLKIHVNDREHPMKSPSGSLSCKVLAEEYGKPVIVAMKTDPDRYQLCFTQNGTSVLISATGYTAEDAEAFAAEILRKGLTAAQIYAEKEGLDDTVTEQRTEYDLIWEEVPEERACIDYTLEAGGENTAIKEPVLPFIAAGFTNTRSGFYFDENGTAVNAYAWLNDDVSSIGLILSDKGHIYPSNFFVNFPEDAERERPVIHIYDMTEEGGSPEFELYCIYNGTGLSLETKGFTANEAEDIAASFVTSGCTVQKLWEMNDYSKYFTLEAPVPVSADFTLETDGGIHELDETSPFFDLSPFGPTYFNGRFYLREDGSAANLQLEYRSNDERSLHVTASGMGKMYAHGQLAGDGGTERYFDMLYGSRTEDGGSALSFRVYDWDCEVIGYGMTDEEMILFYDELAAYLKQNFGDTPVFDAQEYFSCDVSEITTHRTELVWNGLHHFPIEDTVISVPMELQSAEVYCTGDGTAQMAFLLYGTEEKSANIFLSSQGEMGSVFPISGESDGFRRNGVMLYGFSDAQNAAHKELFFVTQGGVGCHLLCEGMSEEEILTLADNIMETRVSPEMLCEDVQ